MKISAKDPATLTAGEINKEKDRLSAQISRNCDALIAAGRGDETHNETAKKDDPLALEYRALCERFSDLRVEIEARYGPGAPAYLPLRGFGPRKRS